MKIASFLFSLLLASQAFAQQSPYATVLSSEDNQQKQIDEILQRMRLMEQELADVKAEQELEIVSIHGQLTSSYDEIATKETYPTPRDLRRVNYLRLRFSLDANVDLDPKVKIYSRFTTTKFFNRAFSEGRNIARQFNDMEMAFRHQGPHVFLEKAYLDYTPVPQWTFSIGRLPTVEGPPSHLWDMQPTQGTYPILNFNLALDGIAGTYRYLHTPHEQLLFRGLFTPLSIVNLGNTGNEWYIDPPKGDITTGNAAAGSDMAPLINIGALQMDYLSTQNDYSERTNVVLQGTLLRDYRFFSGQGTSNLEYSAMNNTLYMEAQGILRSRFDLAASFTQSITESYGLAAPGIGAGSTTDETHAHGYSLMFDGRYRWKRWAVGAEYLEISRQVISFAFTDEDLYDYYRNPGWGKHVYLTHKLTDFLILRLGYRNKVQTSYRITGGPIRNTDRELNNVYLRLRADF
ncbi:DUF3373 family protein [Bdellovibrio reynosensis]|uniref:DUF3373 domain-containing protein n=1 Tax=Bdellovibrio reynosensis TaxID=2835041 RepID=A0ABY4C8Y7_9BACT|nr:DUF3373 family protein [Bdellovibrio reynosensis]UOF01392.1 DUF3373 domain-containing protein [Bdellovibrio reynosensis]